MKDNEEHGSPWRSRGYLPHFDGEGLLQAVTFHLADALPVRLQKQVIALRRSPATRLEADRLFHVNLDLGHGERWLGRPEIAALIENAMLHFDGARYKLVAWVIMPTHVHTLVALSPERTLSDIIHSWKSFTAQKANRLLRRTGGFWQREYHDRYIRDQRHFGNALRYIHNNPVKAGLTSQAENWPWSSARRWREEESP